MSSTMGDDFLRQRAAMSARRGRRESDTRRDLERMHLMTIKREKMRLQQELERVRLKGQHGAGKRRVNNASINAKLLSNRFGSSSLDSSGDEPQLKMRLGTAGTSRREISPYDSRRTLSTPGQGEKNTGLPVIGLAGPLRSELDMRRMKDEQRDPNTKLMELKKNEGRHKNMLSLKVNQFTRSLTPVSPSRSPVRSPVHPSPPLQESRSLEGDDIGMSSSDSRLSKKDGGWETRASFPPGSRRRLSRMSIAEFDMNDAKSSISKRLMQNETDNGNVHLADGGATRTDEALPSINASVSPMSTPRRPGIFRRQSQVAILERSEMKANKYAVQSDQASTETNTVVVNGNNGNNVQGAPKKSAETELNLAVLGRDAKRLKEIIENPEITFDQEKYAPDGALRTMHMMPTADVAYAEARKARYLRWRDPKEEDIDNELSIQEIFTKGKGGR